MSLIPIQIWHRSAKVGTFTYKELFNNSNNDNSINNLTANIILDSRYNNGITINIIPSLNKIHIKFIGPSNLWYDIGFNPPDLANNTCAINAKYLCNCM